MVRGVLVTIIGVLAVRVRQLKRERMIDPKTGVLTFGAWETLASRELARSRRSHAPVALLMLDLDGFKQINDRAGHQRGDAVLRSVGACLGAVLRGYDLVGRFGGDEFVALISAVSADDAVTIGDRLRARLVADTGVTVSIGLVWSDAVEAILDDLIARADLALYTAKSSGGDRVNVSEH